MRQRIAARALVAPAPAGGELHNHPRAMFADARLHLRKLAGIGRGRFIPIAHVNVDEAGPGLEGLMGRFDLLRRMHRHSGIISLAGNGTGDGDCDDDGPHGKSWKKGKVKRLWALQRLNPN